MAFPSSTGNPDPHRKAVLMFRQTLDADGVYVDAALHGSGMTALQYRRERGATTQDIELNIDSPAADPAGETRRHDHDVSEQPRRAAAPGRRVDQAASGWEVLCGNRGLLA